jgi:predicted nucleotidyltransferase
MKPIRLRDFIEDTGGCIYAVSTYDNDERVGCVLRYVPDPAGERTGPDGTRYRKMDFEEAYAWIREHKPAYLDVLHRVPLADVRRVFKPEEEIVAIAARDRRVLTLMQVFNVPISQVGCTGSLLCGLENDTSDIDMVVYGDAWFAAQRNLKAAIGRGEVGGMTDGLWRKVYRKRVPEIDYETFVLHESRKWNRGEIAGTYFDLLYTRSYDNLAALPAVKGEVIGRATIEARVTDASLAFDSPAVYRVEHEERWLVVGTTREAKGEYIISRTLLGQ